MTAPRSVLFVCSHGSAKSVIAAEHCRILAAARGIRLRTDSAGLEPDADIPPHVVAGLLSDGIDVRGRTPRCLVSEDIDQAEWVVSFGCDLGARSPESKSRPRVFDWNDIPAVSENYEAAREAIVRRLQTLLASIP